MIDEYIIVVQKLLNNVNHNLLPVNNFPYSDIVQVLNIFLNDHKIGDNETRREIVSSYDKLLAKAVESEDVELLRHLLLGILALAQMVRFLVDVGIENDNIRRYILQKNTIEKFDKYALSAYNEKYKSQNNDFFCGRGVVYTAITGGYDRLLEPEYLDERYDYICFTDSKKLKSDTWEIRQMETDDSLDLVRKARKHKILCHHYLSEYDYSIYVDGKIKIIGDMQKYINRYSRGNSMICFPHFVRQCAYEEAEACIKHNSDNSLLIQEQMKEYNRLGFPKNYGLIDSACLVRNHNVTLLQSVMEQWWDEVRLHSRRDQLSFNYSCWKHNMAYDLSDLYSYHNEYICKERDGELPI